MLGKTLYFAYIDIRDRVSSHDFSIVPDVDGVLYNSGISTGVC